MSLFLFSAVSVLPFVPSYFVFISVISYFFYFFPEFCQSHFTGEFWKLLTFLPFAHILSYRVSVLVLTHYLYYYCCCDLSIIYMILYILLLLLFLFQQSIMIMIMIMIRCCTSLWNGLSFLSQVIAGRPCARRSLGSLGCFVLCSAETGCCCDMAQPVVPVPPATCLLRWANWPQRAYVTSCAHPVPVNTGHGFHSSGRVLTFMPCHSGGPFRNLSLWTLLSPSLRLLFTCPSWFSVQSQPVQGPYMPFGVWVIFIGNSVRTMVCALRNSLFSFVCFLVGEVGEGYHLCSHVHTRVLLVKPTWNPCTIDNSTVVWLHLMPGVLDCQWIELLYETEFSFGKDKGYLEQCDSSW